MLWAGTQDARNEVRRSKAKNGMTPVEDLQSEYVQENATTLHVVTRLMDWITCFCCQASSFYSGSESSIKSLIVRFQNSPRSEGN